LILLFVNCLTVSLKAAKIFSSSVVDLDLELDPDLDPHRLGFIWLSRIRIGNANLDPGASKLTKVLNNHGFLPFKKAFICIFVGMFFDLLPVLSILSCKYSTLCDF
jgi:hypothetical protein